MQQLNERGAVVTGGASRIGRGLVNRSAADGMNAVIADVEKDPLDQAVWTSARVRAFVGREQLCR